VTQTNYLVLAFISNCSLSFANDNGAKNGACACPFWVASDLIKNLPKPFRTNCNGRQLDYFPQYSRNKCFLEVITKHVVRDCGCRGWFMPETKENVSVCSLEQTLNCMWPVWESLERSNINNCPVDCEKINYEAQLSTALYVPQKLLPLTKHSYLTRAKHMPNDTEGRVQFLLWVFCIIYLWFLAFLFNTTI